MNDLDPVAVRNDRFDPFFAAHDLLVVLDRNSLGRQRQLGDQATERKPVRNFLRFSVDLNLQCLSLIEAR